MFIDTHCHLQWKDFDEDRAMVIGDAKKAGVKKFIVPGVDPHSCDGALHLAKQHPGVIFPAIGFHPYEAQAIQDIAFLTSHISDTVVAIGEIGLDYHLFKTEHAESKKNQQKYLFEMQLKFALHHNLPVIMHCRDAYEDFFNVLDSLPSMPRGVIHCFSGGLQELRFAQERNLYIGVDGNITYTKSLMPTISQASIDMMLLETDTPYLTPIPHRGMRNEPKYIPLIAQKVADLQKTTKDIIMETTTKNASSLFLI